MNENIDIINQKVKVLNRFRHMFYSLKFKSKFLSLLWEKIRLQKIKNKFHPDNLRKQLENEDVDINEVIVHMISKLPY
jgi:hypothetical protein